ncbi:MAG: hypothetical protein IPL74_17870 [Bacteroidetes bacterium]|nr:hypothetical protein [Bacteroidota bacterium]
MEEAQNSLEDFEDVELIPIYDFIGKPDFVKESDLSDEQIPSELERIADLLFDKKIIFDVLSNIDERQIYKFLTEELFQHPILNMPDSEIGSHYFYEDIHPLNEFDTRKKCEEFIEMFFKSELRLNGKDLSLEGTSNSADLFNFRQAFDEFRNVKYEILNADITSGECIRKASISFDAIGGTGIEPIHFSGEATFHMKYIHEYWVVISAMFPGMQE